MKKLFFLSVIFLLNSSLLFSQVAINTDGSAPHPSAGLDVNFTNKGFLLPRMNFTQRNAIQNPAEGLIIYCTDCSVDATGVLSIYQGGLWRIFNLNCYQPNTPLSGTHIPAVTQITWNWNTVPISLGYKWNTVNDCSTATDLGTLTSTTEAGLTCWTAYTRYVWAYNACGQSSGLTLTQSTSQIPFSPAPTAGTHVANPTVILWTWNPVSGATGYRWNTTNNFGTATEMGTATLKTETGLFCNTAYTRYVWAYNSCGASTSTTLTQSTSFDPPSSPVSATHVPSLTQIIWNWTPVAGAAGYKWNTTNNYGSAQDMLTATTKTETGLTCNTSYTRYIWAYSNCGVSTSTILTQSTSVNPPAAPVTATHVPTPVQIIWNWNTVDGATGYKWSTTNDYGTAQDMLTATSKTETGLTCNTSYTRYIWAYSPCGVSTLTTLTQATSLNPPAAPGSGTHVATPVQIIWNWNTVAGATGYKWNTTNDYGTAQDMLTATTKTETGLTCNTSYTRYIWAYSNCGVSTLTTLTQATSLDPPAAPGSGTHVATPVQIIWNWNTVAGATGYKWNTTNNYGTAQDMLTATTKTETGLTCNTSYTRYIWAYSNCGVSTLTTLTQSTSLNPPAAPVSGTHVATPVQIIWNWNTVAGATGYKWNTTNDYGTAQDMLTAITKTETGLTCNTSYTRYIWAYSNCGVSTLTTLTQSTSLNPPAAPGSGTHVATPVQIIWNWNTVSGATGYKWNTTNDYSTAQDMLTVTTKTETGLTCNTNYTRYIWAYSNCGVSASTTLTQATSLNPPAAPVAATHVPTPVQITWNWNIVSGAAGYKWNTTNDYSTAQDMLTATTKIETGLTCNTSYTRYIWAYSLCGVSTPTTLTEATPHDATAAPVSGTHVPTPIQIIWNWNTVTGAIGYKWNTTNDYGTAQDMLTATAKTETGLTCNTPYTRYVWAYNDCDPSTSTVLTQATSLNPPAAPGSGTHVPSLTEIVWHWNTVSDATGYKWSTTNDYGTAQDMLTATTKTETGLTCNTGYTRYVWAYRSCGVSTPTTLTQATNIDPPDAPGSGTHVPSASQIIWNWTSLPDGAEFYKWNTTNNYASATDMSTATTKTETGLTCNTGYTRYVWAYTTCGNSNATTLTQSTTNDSPISPAPATHVASTTQIIWNWNPVTGATGYKWNTTNDYGTATEMNNSTSKTETGLACNIAYTRYVWAYNTCGNSTAATLTQSTTYELPATPVSGTHVPSYTQIVWNWNPVTGATGYKWNTTNNYGSATEMGSTTSKTETGLTCGNNFTRYAWAYNGCGQSTPVTLNQSTLACWCCGNPITVYHVADTVAPVTKTVNYGTVNNIPGETAKCWITSNLGADHQATAVNDATEASAGWYWQFNRTQGFKHDGTTRTPNTTWISTNSELTNWTSANDPCGLELANGWRIPTATEWYNVDAYGSWTTWNGPWGSNLKMHAAGRLYQSDGILEHRGISGGYWSSVQGTGPLGQLLYFFSTSCSVSMHGKALGYSVRCIKN